MLYRLDTWLDDRTGYKRLMSVLLLLLGGAMFHPAAAATGDSPSDRDIVLQLGVHQFGDLRDPDSTVATTGTGAATGVVRFDNVLVTGATQPEYNGWQAVIQLADSLSCAPVNVGDTSTKCAATNAVATTRYRFRYRISGALRSRSTRGQCRNHGTAHSVQGPRVAGGHDRGPR